MKIQSVLREVPRYIDDLSKCVFVFDIIKVVMGMNNHSRIKKISDILLMIFCVRC